MRRRVTRLGGRAARLGAVSLTPTAVSGALVEVAWIAAHLVSYPLGVAQERRRPAAERHRLDDLPPLQRGLLIGDVQAAGTPILLVHGMVDNRSIFALLRRSLRRRGFGRVVSVNYPVLTSDVPAAARRLGEQVERLCAETGHDQVHVVGHSLGGLIARWYVQLQGGDARVHTLVTLGTPHTGTHVSRLFPGRVTRQLRPGSAVMTALAAPAAGCRTRFVAFWSDLDELIVPRRAARLDHPDLTCLNVGLRGVGHLALPIDPRVVHQIAHELAHLDAPQPSRDGLAARGIGTAPECRVPDGVEYSDRGTFTRTRVARME